jgi:hypothetical protein
MITDREILVGGIVVAAFWLVVALGAVAIVAVAIETPWGLVFSAGAFR